MASDGIPVYLPGEYCEVCGSVEDLGLWSSPANKGDDDDWTVTVCHPCYDGDGFKNWIIEGMEEALAQNPDYVRQPDGNWRYIGAASD